MTKFVLDAESRAAGSEMYAFVERLFPICRSLTGEGVRQTLAEIGRHFPEGYAIHAVPSGARVFDWVVPDEWNIRSASIIGPDGGTVVDFADNNLHVVGYSEPVDRIMDLSELQAHLYSLPAQPDAIPYITSYYKRRWGFCLTQRQRDALKPGDYRVRIDSDLRPGQLNFGELLIPGESQQEILLSTYVCHPSMANNELSGPAVTTWLAKWLLDRPQRYGFRILFIPETIGSIAYISRNLETLRERVVAGFNISCVGDDRCFSFLPSRLGDTLSDRAARHVLKTEVGEHKVYSFLERGSDERQYCAPGVDLPVCSILRSKYGEYPEYHTSLDNLDIISPEGLGGSYQVYRRAIELVQANDVWQATTLCEPQLGKRGLYPTLSTVGAIANLRGMMDVLAYADGRHDVIALAERIGLSAFDCLEIIDTLAAHDLLKRSMDPAAKPDGGKRPVSVVRRQA